MSDATTNLAPPRGAPQAVPAADVGRLLAAGKAVDLIDVRTPAEYAAVHAGGARLVPFDKLDPAAVMASRTGPADEPVYVLCQSGARAARACAAFRAAGYANVAALLVTNIVRRFADSTPFPVPTMAP